MFLPNDLTFLNNALCYNKITYCNTVYNAEHILTCYVGKNMLVYRLKKKICIDEKVLFFVNVLMYYHIKNILLVILFLELKLQIMYLKMLMTLWDLL